MTLYDYLKANLDRTEPHSVIDHSIRVVRNNFDSIEFYIHPNGVDGDTPDFLITQEDQIISM